MMLNLAGALLVFVILLAARPKKARQYEINNAALALLLADKARKANTKIDKNT